MAGAQPQKATSDDGGALWLGLKICGVIFVVFVVAKACSGSETTAPSASTSIPQKKPTPEDDLSRLIATTKSDAVYAGQEIVKGFLKAPTQAKFTDRSLDEQLENFALVSMTVDSPNSFGVMLRSRWCALVRFDPPRGSKYHYLPSLGAWDCTDGTDKDSLLIRKISLGWPGAKEEARRLAEIGTSPKKR